MRKQRRGSWGPRRVLDASTRQIMVGDEALRAAAAVKPPLATLPGILSRLHEKDSA